MSLFTSTSDATPGAGRWFGALAGLIFGSLTATALLNAWVDPLFQYGFRADFVPHLKQSNTRMLPGLLRHYPHDGIVLGTSMVENMRPSMFAAHLDYRMINARLSAASAAKQAVILRRALATGNLRYVFWGLDVFAFAGPPDRGLEELPAYLYNDFIGDDYLYLLSPDTLKSSLRTLLGHGLGLWPEYFDMDLLTVRRKAFLYGHQATMAAWERGDFNAGFTAENYSFDMLHAGFERHFSSLLKDNGQVRFDVVFPPYSILAWKDMEARGWLEDALRFKSHVVKELLSHGNVAVHDFQSDASISTNFTWYKDQTHYSPAISQFVLDAVHEGTYRITDTEQLARNLALLEAQTRSYDMSRFLEWESDS